MGVCFASTKRISRAAPPSRSACRRHPAVPACCHAMQATRPRRTTFVTFRKTRSSWGLTTGNFMAVGRTAGSNCKKPPRSESKSQARSKSPSTSSIASVKAKGPRLSSRLIIHTSFGITHVMSSGSTPIFSCKKTTLSMAVLPPPKTTNGCRWAGRPGAPSMHALPASAAGACASLRENSSFGVSKHTPSATENAGGVRQGNLHSPRVPSTNFLRTCTLYSTTSPRGACCGLRTRKR
mmetsp:Transcript_9079/g.27203  ORF Transcript_9079/g.27203 Transcript_9079/m.27203 type:complete len:237 (+) Transcript_9079:1040-1750(+)